MKVILYDVDKRGGTFYEYTGNSDTYTRIVPKMEIKNVAFIRNLKNGALLLQGPALEHILTIGTESFSRMEVY